MPNPPSMFDAPASVTSLESSSADGYIQPTLNHGLRIWWAYFWPTTLIAGLLQFCSGVWLRFMYERADIDAHTFKTAALIVPYATTAAIGLLIFRYLLGKRFRHFRLALLPAENISAATATLRPIWRRTIRVWWTFTWRSVVYTLIGFVVVLLPLSSFAAILKPSALFGSLFLLSAGTIMNGAIALFIIYSSVLDEESGDFRVVLLPREDRARAPIAADTPSQTEATA